MIKSRNRKLIRVTSSDERLEHKCVALSDYRPNRYLNEIWYRSRSSTTHHMVKVADFLDK